MARVTDNMTPEKIEKSFPWRLYILAIGVTVVVICIPMISVFLSEVIAAIAGCNEYEKFTSNCTLMGYAIGDRLQYMFLLGWFMLVTIPFGVVAILLIGLVCLGHLMWLAKKSRNDSDQSP